MQGGPDKWLPWEVSFAANQPPLHGSRNLCLSTFCRERRMGTETSRIIVQSLGGFYLSIRG